MNILLIPLFAILNRLRGANGFTWIGKVGIMAILFYLLWPSWIIGLLAAGFYFLGQSCGWGWWIGYILNQVISPKPIEGIREVFASEIALRIFPTNYLRYSYFSLALIGLFWWLPVILCFKISIFALVSILICSVGFPLSFEFAKRIPVFKIKLLDRRWETGELIYGLLQGLCLYMVV